jgi:hypothetical protein
MLSNRPQTWPVLFTAALLAIFSQSPASAATYDIEVSGETAEVATLRGYHQAMKRHLSAQFGFSADSEPARAVDRMGLAEMRALLTQDNGRVRERNGEFKGELGFTSNDSSIKAWVSAFIKSALDHAHIQSVGVGAIVTGSAELPSDISALLGRVDWSHRFSQGAHEALKGFGIKDAPIGADAARELAQISKGSAQGKESRIGAEVLDHVATSARRSEKTRADVLVIGDFNITRAVQEKNAYAIHYIFSGKYMFPQPNMTTREVVATARDIKLAEAKAWGGGGWESAIEAGIGLASKRIVSEGILSQLHAEKSVATSGVREDLDTFLDRAAAEIVQSVVRKFPDNKSVYVRPFYSKQGNTPCEPLSRNLSGRLRAAMEKASDGKGAGLRLFGKADIDHVVVSGEWDNQGRGDLGLDIVAGVGRETTGHVSSVNRADVMSASQRECLLSVNARGGDAGAVFKLRRALPMFDSPSGEGSKIRVIPEGASIRMNGRLQGTWKAVFFDDPDGVFGQTNGFIDAAKEEDLSLVK